jgi:hypothetical protein
MRYLIIFILLLITCDNFAQHDSSLFCKQYVQAIDYIKQDTMVKSLFDIKECKIKFSDELISGGIDPELTDEFIYYLFNKHYDSVDKKLMDSTYGKIVSGRTPNIYKINCLTSDKKCNLYLEFARENDTIFGAFVNKIQKKSYYKQYKVIANKDSTGETYYQVETKKGEPTWWLTSAADYLFIIDNKNNIKAVLKKRICY